MFSYCFFKSSLKIK